MTDQLRIAAALRKLDDAALERIIALRSINSSNLRDFFDLADALANQKAVSTALTSLTATQYEQLRNADKKPVVSQHIFDLMLAYREEERVLVLPSTLSALNEINRPSNDYELLEARGSFEQTPISLEDVNRDASLAIFEVIQALTELIFELEQRYVREVSKGGVGLPDIKRLANHLRKSNDYAKQVYELANICDLAEVDNSRWQLGRRSDDWINWTDEQRWQHLADAWLNLVGVEASQELLDLEPGQNFAKQVQRVFPLANASSNTRIRRMVEQADLIGLVAHDRATSWLPKLSRGSLTTASQLAIAGLPKVDEKLIIQGDLTLIAPSPLPTALEIRLRRFADTEQVGMASSYRLSALSISHALETGMQISEIREMLLTLSGRDLPQPVEYLLKEADARFARLRVVATKSGASCEIMSNDKILLAEIHNDARLKPFSLHFDEQGNLHSRFEADLLYFALREANFVAVRVDTDGRVISPIQRNRDYSHSREEKSLAQDIARLREADARGSNNPQDDDLLRQIQLAIKNKAKIAITLKLASGDQVEYVVEPVGVANGRLRAKDRKADLERTLPLSSVIALSIQ